MDSKWYKRSYRKWCSSKERHGIAQLSADIWKMREISKKTEKGRCPLHLDKEDVKYTLLSYQKPWNG
jgi:hypothetical protein